MLCVPVKNELELETLLSSDNWIMQQKLDGVRQLWHFDGTHQTGYNRRGESTGPMRAETNMTGWVDTEFVNGKFYAFDYLPFYGSSPEWDNRQAIGRQIFPEFEWIPYYTTPNEKREFLRECKDAHFEGVVFKRLKGLYHPGKRSQDWRKYKFVETADVIVSAVGVTGPLSVGMAMIHDGKLIDVGSVKTQPEVLPHLKVGTVIEVKYLYATDNNKLYQPVWGCLRVDKDAKECTTDQLKYTNKEVI